MFAELTVDGKKLSLPESKCSEHNVSLNIYDGIYARETYFTTEKGTVKFSEERMVSQVNPNLILQCLTVQSDYAAEVCVHTEIDGDVWDINGPHLESMLCGEEDDACFVSAVTHEKNVRITTCEMTEYDFSAVEKRETSDKAVSRKICFTAEAGKKYKIYRKILVTAFMFSKSKNGHFSNERQ